MINKIITNERLDILAKQHALDELGKEHYPEFSEIKYNYKAGVLKFESLFINAFNKACDDIGIGYEKQERLLESIKGYLQ